MSQLDLRQKDSNPDKVYYDLTIANLNNGDTNPVNSPPLIFNEQRQNAIIPNTGDYYLSIVRFQLDTSSLPIFVPIIQIGQPDPNATIYSVTVVDNTNNFAYQVYIQWVNQIANVDVLEPPAPNPIQAESEWYFCYSFEWFVNLVNTALSTAIDSSHANLTNGIASMAWNASSNSATLYLDEANFYTLSVPAINPTKPAFSLYFNQALFTLFSSFPARYLGYGQPFGSDYRILVINVGGTNIQTLIPPQPAVPGNVSYEAINVYQESSTTASISPILGIVFTTNTLPILANQISTPLVYNNNQILDYAGNNSATANIVTDLVSDSGTYSPNLVYTPSAEFRRITMFGNSPLVNLDLNIFYKLRNGSLQPFRLQSGGSVTMKILFEKK